MARDKNTISNYVFLFLHETVKLILISYWFEIEGTSI